MARVGKAAPGGSTRPTSLHQQTGAERQKGTGWAKRSVPTILSAPVRAMVGTARSAPSPTLRICRTHNSNEPAQTCRTTPGWPESHSNASRSHFAEFAAAS